MSGPQNLPGPEHHWVQLWRTPKLECWGILSVPNRSVPGVLATGWKKAFRGWDGS